MKIFFVDDSNIAHETDLGFFLYGGIVVDGYELREIIRSFEQIKIEHGLSLKTEIKWDNVHKIESSIQRELKEDVLGLVREINCDIIVYLAPHYFYHNTEVNETDDGVKLKQVIDHGKQQTALKYATNVCLQKFNSYLKECENQGLIFSDKTQAHDKAMKEHCFSIYPEREELPSFENIAYVVLPVDSKHSQMHQINDVLIGSIQHSLKEFSHNFLPQLRESFWKREVKGEDKIKDFGFNVYPKTGKTDKIKRKLDIVSKKFDRLIVN